MLGDRLRSLREKQNLTQEQIAKKLAFHEEHMLIMR